MTKYAVKSASFSEEIHVGKLNKQETYFVEKEEATDMVLYAVAKYVLDHFEGGMTTNFPKVGLNLTVIVDEMDPEE